MSPQRLFHASRAEDLAIGIISISVSLVTSVPGSIGGADFTDSFLGVCLPSSRDEEGNGSRQVD